MTSERERRTNLKIIGPLIVQIYEVIFPRIFKIRTYDKN